MTKRQTKNENFDIQGVGIQPKVLVVSKYFNNEVLSMSKPISSIVDLQAGRRHPRIIK